MLGEGLCGHEGREKQIPSLRYRTTGEEVNLILLRLPVERERLPNRIRKTCKENG